MNSSTNLLQVARQLRPLLAEHAEESEAQRSLAKASVDALVEKRLLSMSVPQKIGGLEVPLSRQLEVITELSRGDSAAGWSVMITSTSGLVSGFVDEDVAREVFGSPERYACGVYAPMGKARPVEGGYEVTGRWPFGSFCEHAPFRAGGARVDGEGFKLMIFKAEDTTVIDTWDVNGLRGTGSHDFSVEAVHVPAGYSVIPEPNAHTPKNSVYAFPLFAFLAAEISAVSRGIARAALDEFVALAMTKRPGGGKRTLSEKSTVQRVVARCEAQLGSAGAYLDLVVREIEAQVEGGNEIPLKERARLRLAAVHLTHTASEVVTEAYKMAGGTALYNKSPLQRHLRDVFTATQHLMVAESMLEQVGRVFLDQEIPPGVI
jgi:alkylation response protein AidB-like acyl-CoA dehydrogenase